MADKPQTISTIKARAGATPHIVRYVLAISLVLAVVALAWVMLAAPETPDAETPVVTAAPAE